MKNQVYKPKKLLEVEGARTRIAYLLPANRSPLEVLRNYLNAVKAAGGEGCTSARPMSAAATRRGRARAAAAT